MVRRTNMIQVVRKGDLPRKIDLMIIRPLTVFEREDVRSFYLALSPDDRRKRFCCSLSDGTISSYVDGLNFTRDTILGAFDEQAQLIGLAELVRGAEASEMAFSVRPDKRGQKIGTTLMERLLSRARMCGAKKVFVMFLSDNTPMRRMALRAGMSVQTANGESHAARELLPASAQAH
jgi:GNAT superfamily N-acetyltransferase